MEFEKYLDKRKELLNEAEKELNNNGLTEKYEELYNSIISLDEEHKEIKSKHDKEYRDFVNERALEGNNKVPKHLRFSDNNMMRVGENMDTLFLNKGEKLADRVNIEEKSLVLKEQGALGNVIKGMVTGKWENDDLKNAVTTTATGVLIPEVLSAQIIDLARDISLFTSAGVPTVPMESNNMTISRVKTDPTFKFKEEGKEATESNFELDSIKLEAKTIYGYAYITLEAVKSSANLDGIVRQVFAQAMANTIDKAFIYGQKSLEETFDTFAPGGIMNDSSINIVTAIEGGGYDDFIKAIGKVRKANGNPTVYGINSETEELLSLLKTSDGQYLDKPKAIQELTQIVSNQLSYDISKGSDALVFDPRALLVGIQNNLQIKIIEDTECLKKGLVGFQIYSMLDCKAVQPKHICKITGIKERSL